MDLDDEVKIIYHRDYTPATLGGTIKKGCTITSLYDPGTYQIPLLKLTSDCLIVALDRPEPVSLDNIDEMHPVRVSFLQVLVYDGCFLSVRNSAFVGLSSLSFYKAEDSLSTSSPLVTTSAGLLMIQQIYVHGLNLDGASAIQIGQGAYGVISSSEFTEIHSNADGAAIRADVAPSGMIEARGNTFTDCHSTSSGGAFSISLGRDAQFSLGDTFSDCSAGDGGAVAISMSQKSLFQFGGEYKQCTASRNGGAVYIQLNDYACIDQDDVDLTSCSAGNLGHYVYVSTSYYRHISRRTSIWYQFVETNRQAFAFIPNAFVVQKSGDNAGTYQMIDIGNYAYVRNKDSQVTTDCKIHTQPCNTIQSAANTLSGLKYDFRIRLQRGVHAAETDSLVLAAPYVLTGETGTASDTRLLVSNPTGTAASAIFTFTTESKQPTLVRNIQFEFDAAVGDTQLTMPIIYAQGSLGITNCVFTMQNTESKSTYIPTSIVSANSQLFLNHVTFSNITLESSPLIYVAGYQTVYVFNSCVFNRITRADAMTGGAVFDLTDSQSLFIASSSFTRCRSAGHGGAIYMSLASSDFLSIGTAAYEKYETSGTVLFKKCGATDTTGVGGAVYVATSDDPDNLFSSPSLAVSSLSLQENTAGSSLGTAFYINVTARTYVPPSFYADIQSSHAWKAGECYVERTVTNRFDIRDWKEPELTVYPSEEAANEAGAADLETTHYTLTSAYEALAYDGATIHLAAGTHPSDTQTITLSRPLTITGASSSTPTSIQIVKKMALDSVVSPESYITVSEYLHPVTIQSIQYTLTPTETTRGLRLFSVTGNLSLVSVVVTEERDAAKYNRLWYLKSDVISATEGILRLHSCTFHTINLLNSPLISPSTTAQSFTISATTTFKAITRSNDDDHDDKDGAVFSVTVESAYDWDEYNSDYAFNLSHAVFDTCVTKNGNGGAVYLTVKDGVNITLSSLSFINCRAFAQGEEEEETETCAEDTYDIEDPVENPVIPEPETPEEEDETKDPDDIEEKDPNNALGGGLFIQLDSAPALNTFKVSSVSFRGCTAAVGSYFFGYSPDKELAFDAYLWRSLLSQTSADDQFVLSTANDYTEVTTDTMKQAQSIVPFYEEEEDSKSLWWIALIVIFFVLIVVAVIILIICMIRKKN